MDFKKFSNIYRRVEDCYMNYIYSAIGLYKLIIRTGGTLTDEERKYLSFTKKFLNDFYSINDTNITALEEFNKVTELDRVYNNVLSIA